MGEELVLIKNDVIFLDNKNQNKLWNTITSS